MFFFFFLRITVRTSQCVTALTVSRATLDQSPQVQQLTCNLKHLRPSLKTCADQLADVLMDNTLKLCLLQFVMFQRNTTHIPVVKKPRISCLRGYYPIPLTSVIMRCLGLLVKTHTDSLPLGKCRLSAVCMEQIEQLRMPSL